ncbi:hypothetical protein D9758_018245 [Tetrapyrgos nigripes]|uniref:Uncharacterized protein n=1 Tax=Tetrapyrgos nigripes TaxID=182062 RepID=A0A8H5C350_9AGAR|nr:hypothetical protein D9758_018245 [Tetrapyrgos nigripes]
MILRYACLPPEPRTRSAAGEDQSFLDTPSYYLPSSHPHYTPSSSLPPPSPLSRISSNTSNNNTSSNTDYPYPTSASLNPHRTSPAHHFYRTLMDQKRSFALVSKLWNAYSQPALYEWVWLSNKRQAKALALTILCQVAGCGLGPRCPSSPVRYPPVFRHPVTHPSIQRLLRSIFHLPSLVLFIVLFRSVPISVPFVLGPRLASFRIAVVVVLDVGWVMMSLLILRGSRLNLAAAAYRIPQTLYHVPSIMELWKL